MILSVLDIWDFVLQRFLMDHEAAKVNQGGGRPKIPHLRLIFVKKVDLTPLPALSGQEMSIYIVISHDVQTPYSGIKFHKTRAK